MKTVEDLKKQVEEYLDNTEDSRLLCERDRDYKDNKQWTEIEKARLESRNQAAIVVNRIRPKVEGLKGLLIQRKTDPKAYPRTQKHEKAAEAVTDALRFVADNVDFDQLKLEVADNIFVEGTGAAIIGVEAVNNDIEVTVTQIPWDRYYYDNHSRRLDLKDKRFDGIILWMDADHIKDTFGLTDKEVQTIIDEDVELGNDGQETFDDRPRWIDRKKDRIRIAQHFYIEDGVWMMAYFTSGRYLIDPAPSPYFDEFGVPVNPIESQSANIDRDNNRFGEVRYWIDLQDEINHRRSKFLHLNSVRQTAGRKGAIPDVPALKRELSKPDGHVEYNGDKGDFEILKTGDMSDAQLLLYQDGKGELDAVGFNAQLSGERQGDLSGKAIVNLQQAAVNELSSLYSGIANWEKRVYRQIWMRIKQFWGEDKWIRILDDRSKLRWVGLNQRITLQQYLEEIINDETLDIESRADAAMVFQQKMQTQDPSLQNIVETRNDTTELDVDIIIETSLDSINMQQEQFELMAKVAQTRPDIPYAEVLKLSTLRNKDEIIKSMEANAQAQGQAAQQAQQLDAMEKQSKAQEKAASAAKKEQEGIQTAVQTQLLLETPPDDTGVVI